MYGLFQENTIVEAMKLTAITEELDLSPILIEFKLNAAHTYTNKHFVNIIYGYLNIV